MADGGVFFESIDYAAPPCSHLPWLRVRRKWLGFAGVQPVWMFRPVRRDAQYGPHLKVGGALRPDRLSIAFVTPVAFVRDLQDEDDKRTRNIATTEAVGA
jgi:hypothetical protein